MTQLFSTLLQQSLTACWVIPAVLLLRLCLKKAPKRVTNLLWLVVAFRLVCPVSFESDVSLVTQAQNLSHAAAELRDEVEALNPGESQPTVTLPEDMVFDAPVAPVEPVVPETPALSQTGTAQDLPEILATPEEPVSAEEQPFISRRLVLQAGCGIWLAGLAAMALFGLATTRQWRRRVRTAVRGEDGIWRCETVETPFILGLLRPRIYLPYLLPEDAESYVIAHEQAHLRRHDPLLKCLAFVLLSIYWFHPLVWVSYFLFCRDIELTCDQQVTRDMDAEGKKAYSQALLACTVAQADPILCPLSFGEVGVKARIHAVLGKKPGKAFTFTALLLCVILIVACAADPVTQRPRENAYRALLEDLILQYGANEDYGLQAAATLDLWQDGSPDLVVLRRVNDTGRGYSAGDLGVLMIYEYLVDQPVLRLEQTCGDGLSLEWKQTENGPVFAAYTALADREDHPNAQRLETFTVLAETDESGLWKVKKQEYTQLNDSRWYTEKSIYDPAVTVLTEEESKSLTGGLRSLMGQDWKGILKQNRGALSYQRAYLEVMELLERNRNTPDHAYLVDMDGDGIPEFLAAADDKAYLYRFDSEKGRAKLMRSFDLGNLYGQTGHHAFALNLTLERPTLIIHKSHNDEFLEAYTWGEGSMAYGGDVQVFYARGDGSGLRSSLREHTLFNDDLSADEYETLRAGLLNGAMTFDATTSISVYAYRDVWNDLSLCEMEPLTAASAQPAVDTSLYRPVLQELIARYGCFDAGDGTLPVMGLKYAALHDFEQDGVPELITLVNSLTEDQALSMSLQIFGITDGAVEQRYAARLGSRYRQSDVSYTFGLTENELLVYHSADEWTEEQITVVSHLGAKQGDVEPVTYRAVSDDDDPEFEQFWEDGQAVTLGRYGEVMDKLDARKTDIDACWDIAPASRAELMAFLTKLGLDQAFLGQTAPAETAAPDFSVAEGILYYQKRAYNLPNYRDWNASGPFGEQVGDHLLISAHINPDHGYYAVFNTGMLTFDQVFYGQVLDWLEEDLTTLVYCQWNELYTFDGLYLGEFAQAVNSNELLVEEGHYAHDGSTFTVTYRDAALVLQQETLPVPGRDILEAANLLNGRTVWRTGLLFCPTFNALTREEAQALAAELVGRYGPIAQWPFESGQVSRTQEGSVELTLLQPHEESRLCLASTFYLEPDGTIRQAEDRITDGYAGTLLYEGDGYALITSRRSEGCPLGMEPCGYCFVTDLQLWNADRTESVTLLEGAELAINFTVLEVSVEKGILSIAYVTGPAHSEYTTRVFGDIDLNTGVYTETAREQIPI